MVNHVPEGGSPLNPYIFVGDAAAAIAWYTKHLGAAEAFRMPGPDGASVMHAELKIGGQTLMLSDIDGDWAGSAPSDAAPSFNLMLYVEDVDSTFASCLSDGASEVNPLADMFWGDRMGKIKDPFGHYWALATHKEDVSPELVAERAKEMFGG